MDLGKRLARHLHALRQQQGLTLEQLSELSGIPPESLSRFERGRTVPSLRTLERIALGLGLGLEDLVRFERLPQQAGGLDPEVRGIAELLVGKATRTVKKVRRVVQLLVQLEEEEDSVS